jgi:hypothetical protein
MVQMQLLRAKLKVLDMSYGYGTGNFFGYCVYFTFDYHVVIIKLNNYDLYGY